MILGGWWCGGLVLAVAPGVGVLRWMTGAASSSGSVLAVRRRSMTLQAWGSVREVEIATASVCWSVPRIRVAQAGWPVRGVWRASTWFAPPAAIGAGKCASTFRRLVHYGPRLNRRNGARFFNNSAPSMCRSQAEENQMFPLDLGNFFIDH